MNLLIYLNLLVPIIVKIFIPDGRYGSLTIITDTIILPVILLTLNITLLFSKAESSLVRCFSFMAVGLLIGDLVGYFIWGISSKNLLKPDAETAWINKALILYHIGLVVILFMIFMSGKFLIQLLRKKA